MRCSKLVMLLPLVAGPMAAQTFEGTVNYKMSGTQLGQAGGDMIMKTMIKGDMSATLMTITAGPMGPMDVRMIMDGKSGTSTILMPMPAGMGGAMAAMNGGVEPKGMKIVTNPSQMAASQGADKATIKKLGTSQTIAGMSCEDYEVTPEKGGVTRMCVAAGMGGFAMPSGGSMMGGRRGGGATSPAWAKAMPAGSFPLKVWTTDGKVGMEVTSITKGSVPATEFAIPDGYIDPTKMGRGGF